jgi:type III secretion system YscQ/HrcQ family protein
MNAPVRATPFDLRTCPSVRASEARATRAVAETLSSMPAAWAIELPPFGTVTFEVAGIDLAPPPEGSIALGLRDGRQRGRLALPAPLAARFCDLALGGRGTLASARPLGPAERGVLVALLAPALDSIGWALDGTAAPGDAPGPVIAVKIAGALGPGLCWLDLPAGGALPTATWRRRAAGLPVEALLTIAATQLPAAELARLAPGDALVFDGTVAGALAAEADWSGRLIVGGHAATVRIDPRGAVTVVDDFQLTDAPDERNVVVLKETIMDVSGPTQMATAALAAAPIEVTAELARLTLRGEELLGLAPGVVLTMGAERARAVVLRAGGEIWAEGELVDVEGELGVRVTRLLRPGG